MRLPQNALTLTAAPLREAAYLDRINQYHITTKNLITSSSKINCAVLVKHGDSVVRVVVGSRQADVPDSVGSSRDVSKAG